MARPTMLELSQLKEKQREFVEFAQRLGYYVSVSLRHSDTYYPNGQRKSEGGGGSE